MGELEKLYIRLHASRIKELITGFDSRNILDLIRNIQSHTDLIIDATKNDEGAQMQ